MGTGQLDIGAGSPSAGLYNAVARGIDLKIVADTAIGAGKVVERKALEDGRHSAFRGEFERRIAPLER